MYINHNDEQKLSKKSINAFQKKISNFYTKYKREFDWRYAENPYYVLVSEFMLQQTQTSRVKEKFPLFIKKFPTIFDLAHAPFSEVLILWQGLGYNRRAKYVHQAAQTIANLYKGMIPEQSEILRTLDGIGAYTASAIVTFSFNKPEIFIETNIRTVFLHEFFYDAIQVHDKQILNLITQTVDRQNPRSWYYALMDYGTFLKKEVKQITARSAHYQKQSPFIGSRRQIRGIIIKLLTNHRFMKYHDLLQQLPSTTHNIDNLIKDLCKEGFVERNEIIISLKQT